MSTTSVTRGPRRPSPEMPSGSVVLQPPPEVPRGGGEGHWALNLLPTVAGLGSVVFFFVPGANTLMMIVGGLTFASSLVFGAVTAVRQRNGTKGRLADARRDYLKHLAHVRSEVVAATRAQKVAARYAHPDPETLWSLVELRERLWERRQADDDFLTARLGRGTARLAMRLVPPETAPMQELEPMSADALRRLLAVHGALADQPVALPLRSISRLVVSGGPGAPAVCALLAQLATFHSPEDLKICVLADSDRIPRWDWLKWLPHVQHPSAQDAAGPQRMIYDDRADAEAGLEELMEDRPRFTAIVSLIDRPHVILILDTASPSSASSSASASLSASGSSPSGSAASDGPLISEDGLLGVTIVEFTAEPATVPRGKRHQMALHVAPDRSAMVELPDEGLTAPAERAFPIRVDALTLDQAEGLARQLAPLELSAGGGDEPLMSALAFTDLLGIEDAAEIYAPSLWQRGSASPHDRLRVPIGVGEDGQPVVLDLKEAALGGMGPHGLCVGATGSGKSELLRSLVSALALTHSSEQVNFILADFKGGATFAGLAALPHVAAVITNLADDLTLVDRMRDALTGELNRRQELLKRAGNAKNVHDYEKARAGTADLGPLPSLLVVVDEFSELLTARPEFIEMFLQIGRIGRSLGVHLLLASQRVEEGRLRGLDTFLSYRLGLKTFSASESRAVLGVSDAHNLPSVPGSGYLKFDTESLTRFKAAYVSGPYVRAKALAVPERRSALHRRPVWFTALHQAPVVALRAGRTEPDGSEVGLSDAASMIVLDEAAGYQQSSATVLDVIVDRLAGCGPAAHQVWLPPLAEPPMLKALLPGIRVTEDRGLSATRWRGTGRLRVPVGIVDRPAHQRQDPQVLDLSGAGGHVLVAGGPRSGKSTTLQTLMFSLALTHTPAEVRFLVVDLGGGTLTSLAEMPHVSAVAGRAHPDLVRRTVAETVGVLDRREATEGPHPRAGIDQGHVFLVIDGWSAFRDEFETLEQDVVDIARRGLAFGVHLVASTGRWADVRSSLKDAVGTRLELRLGDPMESEMDRRVAAEVPQGVPGRGLTRHRLHTLGAVTDVPPEELAAAIAKAWQGEPAPRVRMLPSQVAYGELVSPGEQAADTGVVIGIEEARLRPVVLDFEAEPHFVVFGEAEAGKSNLLRLLATGLVEEVAAGRLDARFMVIDYRRSLMGVVPDEFSAGYAVAGPAAQSMMAQLAEALRDRLPGPDVTAEQLRTRSWRTGKDVYVFVDDYDLVASPTANPLAPLVELLPYAKDVGLRLVLARQSGGAGRAMFDPVLQKLRDVNAAGLVLSGDREEGPLVGAARPSRQPVGRGQLVRRRGAAVLVQTALVPEPRWSEDESTAQARAGKGTGAGAPEDTHAGKPSE